MLSQYLRCSPATRAWFSNSVLFSQPSRFSEYLLECPRYWPALYRTAHYNVPACCSAEVRQAVSKLIVFTAHFGSGDPASAPPACLANIPLEPAPDSGLSDHLLLAVLALLWVEVSEHGRHLTQVGYTQPFLVFPTPLYCVFPSISTYLRCTQTWARWRSDNYYVSTYPPFSFPSHWTTGPALPSSTSMRSWPSCTRYTDQCFQYRAVPRLARWCPSWCAAATWPG